MSDIFDHFADAYDDLLFGRTSDEGVTPRGFGRREIQCKFCKMGGNRLTWVLTNFKWRLFDTKERKLHICKEYKNDC